MFRSGPLLDLTLNQRVRSSSLRRRTENYLIAGLRRLWAEAICLIIAILATIGVWINLLNVETPSWAVQVSTDGNSLTAAAWWCLCGK